MANNHRSYVTPWRLYIRFPRVSLNFPQLFCVATICTSYISLILSAQTTLCKDNEEKNHKRPEKTAPDNGIYCCCCSPYTHEKSEKQEISFALSGSSSSSSSVMSLLTRAFIFLMLRHLYFHDRRRSAPNPGNFGLLAGWRSKQVKLQLQA